MIFAAEAERTGLCIKFRDLRASCRSECDTVLKKLLNALEMASWYFVADTYVQELERDNVELQRQCQVDNEAVFGALHSAHGLADKMGLYRWTLFALRVELEELSLHCYSLATGLGWARNDLQVKPLECTSPCEKVAQLKDKFTAQESANKYLNGAESNSLKAKMESEREKKNSLNNFIQDYGRKSQNAAAAAI